jgi:hypothetical protein
MKDISNKISNDDSPPLDSINTEKPNSNELKSARKRIYKNLLITGFSWIFLFTAYGGLALLQSSLNSDGGLGTASLSTIYVALIVSCLFLPTTLIEKLGIKYTIVFSEIAYILYILANIYPKYYTLIPTAVILGFGGNFKIKLIKNQIHEIETLYFILPNKKAAPLWTGNFQK